MTPAGGDRAATWARLHAHLAGLDDAAVTALLRTGSEVGTGIGGRTSRLVVDGTAVFVKAVPLTAAELRGADTPSTANLDGLPAYAQYNVGSPGFNAWRELAALERTTRWVLDGEVTGFPLLHHARVLPGLPPPAEPEHADPAEAVAYWHGAEGVARRLAAIRASDTSLVLFLEHLPHRLDTWLADRLAEGGAVADDAIAMVDDTLFAPITAMNRRGLFHFDAHLGNLLTDGQQVLVADLGLATADDFDLDDAERRFLDRHRRLDAAYAVTRFVDLLVTELAGLTDPVARDAAVVDHAAGHGPALPPAAEDVVRRYAPVAVIVNAVYRELFTVRRDLGFPTEALERASDRCTLPR